MSSLMPDCDCWNLSPATRNYNSISYVIAFIKRAFAFKKIFFLSTGFEKNERVRTNKKIHIKTKIIFDFDCHFRLYHFQLKNVWLSV